MADGCEECALRRDEFNVLGKGDGSPCEEHAKANVPSPSQLWHQANDEYPDDEFARRARYITLMIEHGHIIERREEDRA